MKKKLQNRWIETSTETRRHDEGPVEARKLTVVNAPKFVRLSLGSRSDQLELLTRLLRLEGVRWSYEIAVVPGPEELQ